MDNDITLLCNRRWRYSHSYIICHCLNRSGNTFGNDCSGDRSCITLIRVIRFCYDHDCIIIQIVVRRCQFISASYLCISLIDTVVLSLTSFADPPRGSWRMPLRSCPLIAVPALIRMFCAVTVLPFTPAVVLLIISVVIFVRPPDAKPATLYPVAFRQPDAHPVPIQKRVPVASIFAVACNIGCCCSVLCHGQVLCSSGFRSPPAVSFGSSFYGSAVICQNGNVSCCDMIVPVICAIVLKVFLIFTITPPTAAPPAAAKPAPLPVKLPLALLSTRASSVSVRVALVTCGCTAVYNDFRRCPEPLTETTGCSCICIGFQITSFAIRFIIIYIKQCPYSYILGLNLAARNSRQHNRFYCQSGNRRLNRSAYCC